MASEDHVPRSSKSTTQFLCAARHPQKYLGLLFIDYVCFSFLFLHSFLAEHVSRSHFVHSRIFCFFVFAVAFCRMHSKSIFNFEFRQRSFKTPSTANHVLLVREVLCPPNPLRRSPSGLPTSETHFIVITPAHSTSRVSRHVPSARQIKDAPTSHRPSSSCAQSVLATTFICRECVCFCCRREKLFFLARNCFSSCAITCFFHIQSLPKTSNHRPSHLTPHLLFHHLFHVVLHLVFRLSHVLLAPI